MDAKHYQVVLEETHLPENLGDQPLELILVELKAKPGAGHTK